MSDGVKGVKDYPVEVIDNVFEHPADSGIYYMPWADYAKLSGDCAAWKAYYEAEAALRLQNFGTETWRTAFNLREAAESVLRSRNLI